MSVAAVFDAMNRAITGPDGAALARRVNGVIVYKVGEETYTADLKTEKKAYKGDFKGKPDLTITVKAADFMSLAEGKLKPQAAFMRGKIKIKGNMGLAMKLSTVIDAARKAGFEAPSAGAAAASSGAGASSSGAVAASSPGTAALGALEAALGDQGEALVRKVRGIIDFKLTKPDSAWRLDLKTGKGTLTQGAGSGKADLTLTVSDADFAALADGKLKAQAAFMRGKIKIKGNMGLAMKLQGVFAAARPSKL